MAEQTARQKEATAKMHAAARAKREQAKADGDAAPQNVELKTPASMAKPLGLLVRQANSMLLVLPVTRDDALTQEEAEMLVQGLDDAQKASPRFRKYLRSGTESAGLLSLGMAVFMIAFERIARRGFIPGIAARPLTDEEREARNQAWMRQLQQDAMQAEMERQAWRAQQEAGAVPPEWNPTAPATVPPVYSNNGAL